MPQLVGETCAICHERITAAYNARFCKECGNAVHDGCLTAKAVAASDGRCSVCGGDRGSPLAVQRRAEERRAAKNEKRQYPVSKVCPQCGQQRYTTAKPGTWVAFRLDRICTDCESRYTPPTPQWASVLFIVAGVTLLVCAPLFGLTVISAAGGGFLAFVLLSGPLALGGLVAVNHGVRTLNEQAAAKNKEP